MVSSHSEKTGLCEHYVDELLRDLGDKGTIMSDDHLLSSAKGVIIGAVGEVESKTDLYR